MQATASIAAPSPVAQPPAAESTGRGALPPTTLIDGSVNQAYATRRFQSTGMGLITHTLPSFVIIGVALSLVLG